MIDTKRKEELSLAYLQAVCAVRGISLNYNKHDDDGIDLTLHCCK